MNSKIDFFIGPCVLESRDLAFQVASDLKEQLAPHSSKINLYFKGSFDKANRSSINSYRGPGIEEGLRILEDVKKEFSLPVITDFHLPSQAPIVAEVVDVLQVPAFLSRQTDMIVEGAKACQKWKRKIKIKKAQFMAPQDVGNIIEKAKNFLNLDQIFITERGTSFGYQTLIVDMSSFTIMKEFGVKTIHDATHCVQRPGSQGHQTGGNRQWIYPLAKAAVAAGADGLFFETHPHPEKALSDSTTVLPLEKVGSFVSSLLRIYEVI